MMGIFSTTSPFDLDVEKVTPEEDKSTEDWGSILDIVDKVGNSTQNAKDCLKSIIRRLNNPNPHVVLKTITLLDACVNNCPKKAFHLEIASREFEQEFRKLLKKSQPKVQDSLKVMLKKWAENEFKSDPQLSLIPSLYLRLKQEGVDFNVLDDSMKSNSSNLHLKDPDAVTSQQEVDDIAKAIELSLKETSISSGQNSLYPSASSISSSIGNRGHLNNAPKQKKLVKALYDFEAAEDNELTFYTGEIFEVLDDSDKNWWKGTSHRGEGLFPANFVTSDLSSVGQNAEVENQAELSNRNKNRVHFKDSVNVNSTNHSKQEDVVINEQKIDRLLHLLHEANPTDESADTEEMIQLEGEVNAMGPLIDTELEKVDRKHAQLTQLSSNLVDSLNLYHTLMREPFLGSHHQMPEPPYMTSMPMHHTLPHPHSVMYNSGVNGPYSLPPPGMMNEQYNANSLPPQVQQSTGVHPQLNQQPHHFIPIASVPVQSDNFHHPNMVTSPSASNHSYQPNLDPSLVSMQYNMPPNTIIPPQQVPQNMYQPMQHQIPPQDSLSPVSNGIPNNARIKREQENFMM